MIKNNSFIKYIVLFIILVLVGFVGINLYKTPSLDQKQQIQKNNSYLEENLEKMQSNNTSSNSDITKNSNNEEEITKDSTSTTEENFIIEVEEQKLNDMATDNTKDTTLEESSTTINKTTNTTPKNNSTISNENNKTTGNITNNNVIDVTTNNNNNNNNNSSNSTASKSTATTSSTTTKSNSNSSSTTNNNIILETNTSNSQTPATKEKSSTTTSQPNTNTNIAITNQSPQPKTTTPNQSSTTYKNNTSSQTTTAKKLTTNIDFNNINNCANGKVVKKVKATNGQIIKIHECISNYKLDNKGYMMQNFAITNNYVYFSFLRRGTWVKTEAKYQELGQRKSLQQTSANYIARIDRTNNTYQLNYVEYAGHAQSFDVDSKSETVYLNYFSKLYKGSYGYGSRYSGLTSIKFQESPKRTGIEVIPEQAISVNSNGTAVSILKSKNYQNGNTFNSEKYYDKVISIGSSSNKMLNPELAIDEENNRLALVSGKTAYIYKLKSFMNGNPKIVTKIQLATSSRQGVEIADGYLYLWSGTDNFVLRKYKISTGKLVNQISFNLNNYYDESAEGEGISIYNGNVYIGISSNLKNCNEIFLVENF